MEMSAAMMYNIMLMFAVRDSTTADRLTQMVMGND